jgi:hypothetical protein
MDVEWEWQRFGRFPGTGGRPGRRSGGVRVRSGDSEPGWIVYLTGRLRALDGRYATEFDAMLAAEAALVPQDGDGPAV